MDLERDVSNSDEYLVTAVEMFDYCNADSNSTLRVETLMEKIAPFVKNKSESDLRALLDPDHTNPEITVAMLSKALSKYSEKQLNKADLEESFNLKSGPVPQDSDSGISSDGFQLLEELQCELREKDRLAVQLRNQIHSSEHQHEEAVSELVAERDTLRAHVNILRDENSTLMRVREDYEEATEKLTTTESSLEEAQRALEAARRRAQDAQRRLAALEGEKGTLQDLLKQSKHDCHRINDMYASRQSALIEQNEALKTECAELGARLQDQEVVMQQLVKEKVQIEMELKDQLNKSSLHSLRLERSADVSYTEDQLLLELDSRHSDSRFAQDNTLDETSFFTLSENAGRPTNLLDEIRLSIGNVSRKKDRDIEQVFSRSSTVGTMCDDFASCGNDSIDFGLMKKESNVRDLKALNAQSKLSIEDVEPKMNDKARCQVCFERDNKKTALDKESERPKQIALINAETQCQPNDFGLKHNETQCELNDFGQEKQAQCEVIDFGLENKQTECEHKYFEHENKQTQCEVDFGLQNKETQCKFIDFGFENKETECELEYLGHENKQTQCELIHFGLENKETQCKFIDFGLENKEIECELKYFGHENKQTQCELIDFGLQNKDTECELNDFGERNIETEYHCAQHFESNNNNVETNCAVCKTCTECDQLQRNIAKLEKEITLSQKVIKDLKFNMGAYEDNLKLVKALSDEEKHANWVLKSSVKGLKAKIEVLQRACTEQKARLESLHSVTATAECQTFADVSSVSTQAEIACEQCEARAFVPKRTWRSRVWAGLSSLFSLLALLCFAGALCFLYQVSQYHFAARRCGERPALPWAWLRVGDVLDAVFRVEYVGEVPM